MTAMQTNLMQCTAYGLSCRGWPSAAMLAAIIRLFPKHNLWIWCWARALNFFGRPWQGLFWVEPVLLNCCIYLFMHLADMHLADHVWSWPLCCSSVSWSWQSSYSLHHLYVEQQFFFSDPQRVLCHEVPCWTSSDQYERVRAITPNSTHLLPIHSRDLVTLTSHMTPGRENGLLGPAAISPCSPRLVAQWS